jgi:hypothetical protein
MPKNLSESWQEPDADARRVQEALLGAKIAFQFALAKDLNTDFVAWSLDNAGDFGDLIDHDHDLATRITVDGPTDDLKKEVVVKMAEIKEKKTAFEMAMAEDAGTDQEEWLRGNEDDFRELTDLDHGLAQRIISEGPTAALKKEVSERLQATRTKKAA